MLYQVFLACIIPHKVVKLGKRVHMCNTWNNVEQFLGFLEQFNVKYKT